MIHFIRPNSLYGKRNNWASYVVVTKFKMTRFLNFSIQKVDKYW